MGVMTGEGQMAFGTPLSVAGGIDGGKLRPIAVTTDKRINVYPNVPTIREQGLDYVNGAWFGILAPANTPAAIVRELFESIRGMAQPDVRKKIEDSGTDVFVTSTSPEGFARFIAEETKVWNGVLKGMTIEQP